MMTILVVLTWVCIALGFFVNPAFFLLGVIIFLIVAVWWTVLALKQKMDWKTIFIVWVNTNYSISSFWLCNYVSSIIARRKKDR